VLTKQVDEADPTRERCAALAPENALPNLARKASLNSVASALDYGVRLLVSFVVKPLLVAGLGAWGYGAWEMLTRLAGYVGPATGRAGHALRSTIAKQQHLNDYREKRTAVGSAVTVTLLLTPVCGLLAVGLAWWAPHWLNAPAETVWVIRLTALILGVNVVLMRLVDLPRAVLEGENLGYKRMGMSALLVALGGGLTVLALWLELGLVGVAAAMIVTSCVTGVFFLSVVRNQVAWFGVELPSWKATWQFFRLSGWFLGWNTIVKLMRASDVIVLGLLASVPLVGTYTLTKYAPEAAINLVGIVVFGIAPGLGGIIGSGNFALAARIRAEIMALTWLIATVMGTTTLMWNETFLRLWVGNQYDAGATSTLLIVVMVTQFVLIRSDANVISLTLDLRGKVLLGLIAAIASLAISISLVGPLKLGIEGLCLGIVAGRIMLSIGYPWIIGRYLGISTARQLLSALRPALLTAIVFLFAIEFGGRHTPESWLTLAMSVAATLIVLPLPLFYFGLPAPVRDRLKQRLRHIVSRQSSGQTRQ